MAHQTDPSPGEDLAELIREDMRLSRMSGRERFERYLETRNKQEAMSEAKVAKTKSKASLEQIKQALAQADPSTIESVSDFIDELASQDYDASLDSPDDDEELDVEEEQ